MSGLFGIFKTQSIRGDGPNTSIMSGRTLAYHVSTVSHKYPISVQTLVKVHTLLNRFVYIVRCLTARPCPIPCAMASYGNGFDNVSDPIDWAMLLKEDFQLIHSG